MTKEEQLNLLRTLVGNKNSDDVLLAYLRLAKSKILRIVYPYDPSKTEVPAPYEELVVEAAVYLVNKRGGEGQLVHSENGISITYETGDLPKSLVRQIVPFVG